MKHHIFLSYKYTGVPHLELNTSITLIKEALEKLGNQVFCSLSYEALFREQGMSYDDMLAFCISKQQKSDITLFFLNHEEPSHGMTVELQNAIKLNQIIIVRIKSGLKYPQFRQAADTILEFSTIDEITGDGFLI